MSVTKSRFAEQLNVQIGNEFEAHQQYISCAVYYDALTMPQMAALFYAQASEERNHAMMMIQYLLDIDHDVVLPGVAAPISRSPISPLRSTWRLPRRSGSPPRSTS